VRVVSALARRPHRTDFDLIDSDLVLGSSQATTGAISCVMIAGQRCARCG